MTVQLFEGDCRVVLRELADGSVDSIVTDPPYELGFMGKKWDASGIAYDVELWSECLRVLKPGGHLLAFGGTRTYHRMAVAIEDAGFEIRDSIHWLYGSGFPKSLDVSKAIDKAGGNRAGFAEFRDAVKDAMKRNNVSRKSLESALGNYMLSHYLTAGSQPAVPNYRDYVIIRDYVRLGDTFDDLFAPEAEREVVGSKTSGIANKDEGPRHTIGASQSVVVDITAPATDAARQWEGWGTALKPAHEPIVVARKPLTGTVAATVLEHCTGALNIEGCRVAATDGYEEAWDRLVSTNIGACGKDNYITDGSQHTIDISANKPSGRWPANLVFTHAADCGEACAEGCPVAELDEQSDGASRFFTVTEFDPIADVVPFRYVAKSSKQERNAGLEDMPKKVTNAPASNHHPTVKPVQLMRWLVRLVTPPGGTVLDPFAGSGTTLVAAVLEGFDAIGIELTADYHPIIQRRINWAEQQPQPLIKDHP